MKDQCLVETGNGEALQEKRKCSRIVLTVIYLRSYAYAKYESPKLAMSAMLTYAEMPLDLQNTLTQSIREKILPSLISSLALALISPVTKVVKAWRIAGKKQKLFSDLEELNKQSLSLKQIEIDAPDLDITAIKAEVHERRGCVIADLTKVDLTLAERRKRGDLPLIGWKRLLLLFSPKGWNEWLQMVQYFACSFLTGQFIWTFRITSTEGDGRWIIAGFYLAKVAMLAGYFVIAWYFNERVFYLREARLGRRPPERFSRWLIFSSYASLSVLLTYGSILIWFSFSVLSIGVKGRIIFTNVNEATSPVTPSMMGSLMLVVALTAESLWILFQVHRQSLFSGRFAESSAQTQQAPVDSE